MYDKDPSLTPAQDQEVRRLLAGARHDEPMPEDVATRLERVLAQLAAGDPPLDPGTVVELASRRRRRAASLLIAAAVVVAVGIGLGQVVGPGETGADTASSDTTSGEVPEAADRDADAQAASPADSSLAGGSIFDLSLARYGPIKIRSEHFATDVERARNAALVRVAYGASQSDATAPEAGNQSEDLADGESNGLVDERFSWFECTPADFGKGRLIPVLYDGESAVLALRRAVGDTRVADLLQCGSGEILRSITLATP